MLWHRAWASGRLLSPVIARKHLRVSVLRDTARAMSQENMEIVRRVARARSTKRMQRPRSDRSDLFEFIARMRHHDLLGALRLAGETRSGPRRSSMSSATICDGSRMTTVSYEREEVRRRGGRAGSSVALHVNAAGRTAATRESGWPTGVVYTRRAGRIDPASEVLRDSRRSPRSRRPVGARRSRRLLTHRICSSTAASQSRSAKRCLNDALHLSPGVADDLLALKLKLRGQPEAPRCRLSSGNCSSSALRATSGRTRIGTFSAAPVQRVWHSRQGCRSYRGRSTRRRPKNRPLHVRPLLPQSDEIAAERMAAALTKSDRRVRERALGSR